MKFTTILATAFAAIAFSGCSTTQEVTLAKASPTKQVISVARSPDEGNSPAMDQNLELALITQGLQVKAPVPASTRKSSGTDAVISYVDLWRWDLVMYLKSITVNLYDAETGDLLVTGRWADSPAHGFRDAKVVVNGLVSEMLSKLRAATKQN
jgi:hypothetical protein